jgi:cysteine desulfurase
VIYADNAATTKITESVFEKMLPFLCEQFGNVSSQYSLGVKSKRAIELSRHQVATAIGADPSEITFTSGGSESNSWVLRSVIELFYNEPIHIITSSIEHHSVLNACHKLEQYGFDITYLPVSSTGRIAVSDVEASIKPTTKMISVMLANNEIGTIQPIAEIGRMLKGRGILFHTDAVQAVGHIPVDISVLGVDYLTASAHKFCGAKGTGFLYMRSGLELPSLIFGGKQEHGFRSGTENIAGIVSMGYAIEESVDRIDVEAKRLEVIIQTTIDGIKKRINSVRINGDSNNRLPGIINLGFDEISGEALIQLLDLKGICVSTGSACNSGKDEASHVLLALGQTTQQAESAIRISYGKDNTVNEAEAIVSAVCNAYYKIKNM